MKRLIERWRAYWRWNYIGEAWDEWSYSDTGRQVIAHWTLQERGNGERRAFLAPTGRYQFDRNEAKTRVLAGKLDAWIHGGPLPSEVITPRKGRATVLTIVPDGRGGAA